MNTGVGLGSRIEWLMPCLLGSRLTEPECSDRWLSEWNAEKLGNWLPSGRLQVTTIERRTVLQCHIDGTWGLSGGGADEEGENECGIKENEVVNGIANSGAKKAG